MSIRPSYTHVFNLIIELRQAALDNGEAALAREDGGWGLCLGSALANDAADALEAMLAERHQPKSTAARTVVSINFGSSEIEPRAVRRQGGSPRR